MWWGEFYAGLTILTWLVTWRSKNNSAGIALGGLVMWFGLANLLNVPGTVDRGELVFIDIALSTYCLTALYLRWSSVLASIFVIAISAAFWSLYGPEEFVKDGKNGLYFLGLATVFLWALTQTSWRSQRWYSS